MNRLQKSLALSFVLVCFPLGVLAQPQKVPSTQGEYVPRPSEAEKKILLPPSCAPQQCRAHRLFKCRFLLSASYSVCLCGPAPIGRC